MLAVNAWIISAEVTGRLYLSIKLMMDSAIPIDVSDEIKQLYINAANYGGTSIILF
ncbi:MAG: hypothetical protein MRQ07_04070 [Candidatus Midichloria sp.]|nr:hypothetical protein [Candidatus Midichloria sp.]